MTYHSVQTGLRPVSTLGFSNMTIDPGFDMPIKPSVITPDLTIHDILYNLNQGYMDESELTPAQREELAKIGYQFKKKGFPWWLLLVAGGIYAYDQFRG